MTTATAKKAPKKARVEKPDPRVFIIAFVAGTQSNVLQVESMPESNARRAGMKCYPTHKSAMRAARRQVVNEGGHWRTLEYAAGAPVKPDNPKKSARK